MHKFPPTCFGNSAGGDFVYLLCIYSSACKFDFISWKFWEFLCRMCSSQYAACAFSVILKVWSSFAITVSYVSACSVWHVVMYCYDHRHLVGVAQLFGAFALLKATLSFVSSVRPSVRMEQLDTHWTDFPEIWYLFVFFENLWRKFKFHWNPIRMTGVLHEDQFTFLIIFAQFFVEWKMFQTKVVVKIKKNTFYVQQLFSP